MSRQDKCRAVTRYLATRTGIPSLFFASQGNTIEAPPPYKFVVSTDAAWWRMGTYLRSLPEDSIGVVVRYDKLIEGGIDNAVVAMRLSAFVQLLEAHYNTIQDRVETFIEGEK